MKTHTLYTREDCGCFADGSYGDGISFEFVDGDLLLIADEECE